MQESNDMFETCKLELSSLDGWRFIKEQVCFIQINKQLYVVQFISYPSINSHLGRCDDIQKIVESSWKKPSSVFGYSAYACSNTIG
jgi:hypothetical protein